MKASIHPDPWGDVLKFIVPPREVRARPGTPAWKPVKIAGIPLRIKDEIAGKEALRGLGAWWAMERSIKLRDQRAELEEMLRHLEVLEKTWKSIHETARTYFIGNWQANYCKSVQDVAAEFELEPTLSEILHDNLLSPSQIIGGLRDAAASALMDMRGSRGHSQARGKLRCSNDASVQAGPDFQSVDTRGVLCLANWFELATGRWPSSMSPKEGQDYEDPDLPKTDFERLVFEVTILGPNGKVFPLFSTLRRTCIQSTVQWFNEGSPRKPHEKEPSDESHAP